MGHARYAELRDIHDVLEEIRRLPAISEPAPGIFYLRRVPFLHFHTKPGVRWADAKVGSIWGPEIPIPLGAGPREKSAFLLEVRRRHESRVALMTPRLGPPTRRPRRAARSGRGGATP